MTLLIESLMEALVAAPNQTESTTLADSWLLGFDTETTGTRPGSDAIVSATLVLRDPQRPHSSDTVGEWIINPHRAMNPKASEVNGFTDAFLQEHGSEPVDSLAEILDVISLAQSKHIPLLAYNAPFDVHMLRSDLKRWDLAPLDDVVVVDPLVIDRAVSKRSGKRTLAFTTEYYAVEATGDFHNATADTVAAIDLIAPMSTLYPQVGNITLDELMPWQRQAYTVWKESFNTWLNSKGRTPIHDTWL